jgi:flagellar biosynthesis protein FlhA
MLAVAEKGKKNLATDISVTVLVVMILGIMIIPLPPYLMDVLIAVNITCAIVLLMVSLYINEPNELSVFPSLLLVLTLFRLSLNISSTRLILSDAYAGDIILAFGDFIIGGNYIVGFIMFIILVLINFLVIVKGSGRISEVAARFALDAMPGKQMSIDADLGAGLIDENEAKERRKKVASEAEFHGAMDGASKFVKGDAIAGLIITAINIIAGFIIGIAQLGMSFSEAIETYSILTIGDGLVSQIPALLISTAAGMVVARSTSDDSLGTDIKEQLFGNSNALYVVAGTTLVLGLIPGMPFFPFVAISGIMIFIARKVAPSKEKEELREQQLLEANNDGTAVVEDKIEEYLQVDILELEIGYGLIEMVDKEQGGDLFDRITSIRKQLAVELGIIVPPIRIRDNLQLQNNKYLIKIRGVEIAEGELLLGHFLAMDSGFVTEEIDGLTTREPAFGLAAKWIKMNLKEMAEINGYTVVEPTAVLSTHLIEVLRKHADKLLGREETQKLIETVKEKNPTVIKELNLDDFSVGNVQKVLQGLLNEGISIRDLVSIFESLADYLPITKNVDVLVEYVRHSLAESIASKFQEDDDVVRGLVIDAELEQLITNAIKNPNESQSILTPQKIDQIATKIKGMVDEVVMDGHMPIVFTSPQIRSYFKKIMETSIPELIVLSFGELPPNQSIESLGKIGFAHEN